MYIYMYIYIYVYMCIYIYVYIYTLLHHMFVPHQTVNILPDPFQTRSLVEKVASQPKYVLM